VKKIAWGTSLGRTFRHENCRADSEDHFGAQALSFARQKQEKKKAFLFSS